jgi:hypothetical protein
VLESASLQLRLKRQSSGIGWCYSVAYKPNRTAWP